MFEYHDDDNVITFGLDELPFYKALIRTTKAGFIIDDDGCVEFQIEE